VAFSLRSTNADGAVKANLPSWLCNLALVPIQQGFWMMQEARAGNIARAVGQLWQRSGAAHPDHR
jgi:hypothetical protein